MFNIELFAICDWSTGWDQTGEYHTPQSYCQAKVKKQSLDA